MAAHTSLSMSTAVSSRASSLLILASLALTHAQSTARTAGITIPRARAFPSPVISESAGSVGRTMTTVASTPMISKKHRSLLVRAEREVSNRARLRQEVANPFAVVRLWGSAALSVQATVASLVAISRLTASIANAPGADSVQQSAQTLGIDLLCLGALVGIFLREKSQEALRLEKFEREERLAQLVCELPNGKRAQLQDIQGFARLVIVSGQDGQLFEAIKGAEEWRTELSERAVIVVPVRSQTDLPSQEDSIDWASWRAQKLEEKEKPFLMKPVREDEWQKWISEQKTIANVADEQMVWISLRKDGRVRSSGKGNPKWQRFAQTIPVDKGAWGGFLDGMDGRV